MSDRAACVYTANRLKSNGITIEWEEEGDKHCVLEKGEMAKETM